MSEPLRTVLIGLGGLAFGIALTVGFSLLAITRLERENDRLRRLVNAVTEDVS